MFYAKTLTIIASFKEFLAVLSTIGPRDAIDIFIVATLIYFVLLFIKQTHSYFVFNSFLFILLIIYLSDSFNLALTKEIFQPVLTFFLVIFVIVFQKEIRHFLDWFSLRGRHIAFFAHMAVSGEVSNEIVKAVETMAKQKMGAIIIIPGEYPLDGLIEGGSDLDGKVSASLLMSIFDTGSPGHDGAVLVDDSLIKQFGLHLPLAENFNRYGEFGTRHRAAAGITERSDALAIVVSEERGTISLAEGGTLIAIGSAAELEAKIKTFLKENIAGADESAWHYFFFGNFFTKISSVLIAVFLWYFLVYSAIK